MIFPEPKNLSVLRVREAATSKERVLIRALRPCDLGRYAIVVCRWTENGYFPLNRLVYWFPDAEVAEDDLIVLHTRKGTDGSRPNVAGGHTHHFFWNFPKPVWLGVRAPALVYIAAAQMTDEKA